MKLKRVAEEYDFQPRFICVNLISDQAAAAFLNKEAAELFVEAAESDWGYSYLIIEVVSQ